MFSKIRWLVTLALQGLPCREEVQRLPFENKMGVKWWAYDASAGRRKHRWNKPVPGFEKLPDGTWVGKCPCDVTKEEAEQLLNEGVEESSGFDDEGFPDTIYLIRKDWVFQAYPTQPGVSYHAFPACPRALRKLPKSVRQKILELATQKGCGQSIRKILGLK